MRDVQSKDIDGRSYQVTMLDEKTARRVWLRLMQKLGPSVAELAKGLTSANVKSVLDLDTSIFAGALARLLREMSEDDLEFFVEKMRSCTKVKPEQANVYVDLYDGAFQGRLTTMFKWLVFALEVNYADFLSELRSMLPRISPSDPAAPKSESPTA
jgi:hypothetical protein